LKENQTTDFHKPRLLSDNETRHFKSIEMKAFLVLEFNSVLFGVHLFFTY